jgi:lipid A disaccharide synthetase
MRRAGAAVTIPGTNTAELAALGIPMLLVLPAYRLHALPLPGLPGHLGGLPVIGPAIKECVARLYLRTRRFWAHPNRLAGSLLVPELVGRITSEEIADGLAHLLASPLSDTASKLRRVMGAPGASYRLVDEVLDLAQHHG